MLDAKVIFDVSQRHPCFDAVHQRKVKYVRAFERHLMGEGEREVEGGVTMRVRVEGMVRVRCGWG